MPLPTKIVRVACIRLLLVKCLAKDPFVLRSRSLQNFRMELRSTLTTPDRVTDTVCVYARTYAIRLGQSCQVVMCDFDCLACSAASHWQVLQSAIPRPGWSRLTLCQRPSHARAASTVNSSARVPA